MTATTIYFVRHGQTQWNLEQKMQGHMDSPLTPEGRRQAARLGDRLQMVKFDAIYSSPSPRALTTAQIISGSTADNIMKLDELKEIHMGVWEGQSAPAIQNEHSGEWEHFFKAPHLYRPTGQGETFSELLDRTITAVEKILQDCKGETVLVVSHRMTLKTLMNHYSGMQLSDMGDLPDVPSASLSKIVFHHSEPTIELYGDSSHY
ncbi:histidine phosphatase family protein [Paenibacillus radicis (ex Gao et al. 2016)]|uniref:Phosphatase n=1 Tax=Paenibacillus radicis (ex Gao et al. 2016) TaxID=1737354 RepID=A0A917H7L7_9BACL|nr:histidine phosphatase family protein [Paenibacillus radicis (ex Gao et al. 2016)]GGG69668.1 phosphatase [Paenibacillus radicis (ex Gao et al. 2016)]